MIASKEALAQSFRGSAERIVRSAVLVATSVSKNLLSDTEDLKGDLARQLRQARAVGQVSVLTLLNSRNKPANPTPATVREAELPESSVTTSTQTSTKHLAINNYLDLTAKEIVPLLANLTDEERAAVLEFEISHRRRTTILRALNFVV